ncbi:radial spoke head protein 9 homolog [Styela clava]|uniref:radial spoke head protein 9 homolog n=1 Tax=Styela clava TaxID=7725 RepID=UPI0019397330|nr:radial spoke head protein 9 homolog [Styela clava]XP_039260855.1 radial spoke head protein 9 homolog [Styela clava]
MDAEGLHLSMNYISSSGIVLSAEQKAALETSMVILRTNYKFHKVWFWGKILGIKDDYFIAQGAGRNELSNRKTLYSLNCVEWHLLPPASETAMTNSKIIHGRFQGDPSYEYEHTEVKRVGDGEDFTEEEVTIHLKEEDRLAAVISSIDEDAAIVPRGAFVRTPLGEVHTNRSFEGLSVTEAGKLSSYMHFREGQYHTKKTIKEKADLDPSIDFLDCIEEDIPRGSWSLKFERGSGLVCLRSLMWLGQTFYHVPDSRKYGRVYVGTGEKNLDIPFML